MRAFVEDMLDDFRVWLTGPVGRWRAVRLSRGPIGGAALVFVCAAVYVPGLFRIPPVDRDEARFAQASRQMLESVALPAGARTPGLHDGGLLIPKVQDRPRLNKPPLIYWAQAGSAWIFTGGDPLGDAIWMYRLPSAVFATIAVLATWRIGVCGFDPRAGWLGALLLAVCPMVVWDAHQARADQLLLACTTLALWGLFMVWSRARHGRRVGAWPVLLWLAVGLGMLAKGPITPMVVVLCGAALCATTRRSAWLRATRPVLGLGVVVAVVAPWLIAVCAHIGFNRYWSIVFDETLGRSGAAREGHWGPPGYHLIFLVVLFWPGVLLTAVSLGRAWQRAKGVMLEPADPEEPVEPEASDDAGVPVPRLSLARARLSAFFAAVVSPARGRGGELFCLAWIVPSWLVFELVATKLPHYTLPLYPPIALLTARGLLAAADGALRGATGDAARLGHWIWLGVGVLIVAALPLLVAVFGGAPVIAAGVLIALAGSEMLRRAWRRLGMGDFVRAQAWSVASVLVSLIGLLGVVMPAADGLWISPQVAAMIETAGTDRPVAAAGYHEDSLVFLTRGRLEKIDDAVAWLGAHRNGVLVARPSDVVTGEPGVPEFRKLGTVRGVNYSRGEPVVLGVYEAGSARPARDGGRP